MEIAALFLVLALAVLVALFVARPFLGHPEGEPADSTPADHERSGLLAERDRVLNSLQDLDFDHTLGKIPAEDYPIQRAALVQHGADVLRRLDALDSAPGEVAAAAPEERLEAAVAARRTLPPSEGLNGSNGRPLGDAALEAEIEARRLARKEQATGFCPHCGKPFHSADKFCARCGKPL